MKLEESSSDYALVSVDATYQEQLGRGRMCGFGFEEMRRKACAKAYSQVASERNPFVFSPLTGPPKLVVSFSQNADQPLGVVSAVVGRVPENGG